MCQWWATRQVVAQIMSFLFLHLCGNCCYRSHILVHFVAATDQIGSLFHTGCYLPAHTVDQSRFIHLDGTQSRVCSLELGRRGFA